MCSAPGLFVTVVALLRSSACFCFPPSFVYPWQWLTLSLSSAECYSNAPCFHMRDACIFVSQLDLHCLAASLSSGVCLWDALSSLVVVAHSHTCWMCLLCGFFSFGFRSGVSVSWLIRAHMTQVRSGAALDFSRL